MRLLRSALATVVCACLLGVATPAAMASESTRQVADSPGTLVVTDVKTTVSPTGTTSISGRVTDSKTGKGVPARITGYNERNLPFPVWGDKYTIDESTNASGDFRITEGTYKITDSYSIMVELRGGVHHLSASCSNYRTQTVDKTVVEGKDNRVNFSLVYHVPTGYLDVHLRDSVTGAKPGWNFMLVCDSTGMLRKEYRGTSADMKVNVTPGIRYHVYAWSLDYSGRWYPGPVGSDGYVKAADGQVVACNVKMTKGVRGTLSATVTDKLTHAGIPGIKVAPTLFGPYGRVLYTAAPLTTNSLGVAQGTLPVGTYHVEYRDPTGAYGYQAYSRRACLEAGDAVNVASSKTVSAPAELTTGYAFQGTLTDTNGDPVHFGHGYVPIAVVIASYDSDKNCGNVIARVPVAADGTYEVKGLSAWERLYLSGVVYDEVAATELTLWTGTNSYNTYWGAGTQYVLDGSTPTTTVDVRFMFDQPDGAPAARYGGSNRYETAVGVARETFSGADTAILATGESFPDALSASALAGALDAPLLLSRRTSIDWTTLYALKDLGVKRIVIVGSTSAVSSGVVTVISRYMPWVKVERIGGTDRYQTSRLVAERVAAEAGTPEGAFLARGDSFADALAVSPIAFAGKRPVLLTPPTALGAEARRAITTLGIDDVTIVGGTAAVAPQVADAVGALPGMTVRRLGGANRYATTAAVVGWGIDSGLVNADYIGIATGLNFPDALGGGIACGKRGGVLLLTAPATLSAETKNVLIDRGSPTSALRVFGSTSSVSKATADAAASALTW